ncbi:MAG TPA: pyridoxamine 5'-phosphate oxidase family protein [Holophaga sp.]|nr:pyridoxamine 5'-phosphate oxidase family protein [Holophaga sp.]
MTAPSRPLRRKDRAVPEAEAWGILQRADWGVLSTVGADGWPYGVPLNHVVVEGRVYAHAAATGHKLDNLAAEARASYCAVSEAEVRPANLATRYASAILFGRVRLVTEAAEREQALRALAERFAPGETAALDKSLVHEGPRTAVLRLDVERITGKRNPGD